MKLYLVEPNLSAGADRATVDAWLRACIAPIADLIAAHLAEDPALFAMRHSSELAPPCVPAETSHGYAEVARITDPQTLRSVLMASGNPFDQRWMLIRSLVTCRAVHYGYDGQAFVCLPSEAAPILSPDPALITVTECSHLLAESDRMDGLNP